MDEAMLRKAAYAMPLNNPSYPPGPYRFIDREYMIITYRTDCDSLRRIVPRPLEVMEPIVKYEFIRMPDSTGFGDYTESGQVIPVRFGGERAEVGDVGAVLPPASSDAVRPPGVAKTTVEILEHRLRHGDAERLWAGATAA